MKKHLSILVLVLGVTALAACKEETLGPDLGVTNVVLPDISEKSLGTEVTIRGNGFIDCDELILAPVSGGTGDVFHLETREVTPDYITVFYPANATADSYGLVLQRGSKIRSLGVLNNIVGIMPDANLRNYLAELHPSIFKGDKIVSSAKHVNFAGGLLDITGKGVASLEGLQHFENITRLTCSDNDIKEIPSEMLYRLTELTACNTGLTTLKLGTQARPNTTLVGINIDGSNKLDSVDLYYCYKIERFSAARCALTYLDVRNHHSIYGGCLNYNGNDFKFTFSDDTGKERLLKMESWWMDSYYYSTGSVVEAIEKGVTVEGYDWLHDYPDGNGTYYYSYGKYQKTMRKYGEIPDANLRNALKALVPDLFENDKVLTVKALNSDYFKNNTTLDLSNKGIKNLEGLQYFCGYKHLILDGNNLGDVELSKYAVSTSYTAGPVDERGIESVSIRNANLTRLVSGDQYMMRNVDVSGNAQLTHLDLGRCKFLKTLDATGCPLQYLDIRNMAGGWSELGYSSGHVDANQVKFDFTNDGSITRRLLVEEWWMDSPWINGSNACTTAKDKGVRVERYEYTGYNKDKLLSSFN